MLKCNKCKHEWKPRQTEITPKICPKCKSEKWYESDIIKIEEWKETPKIIIDSPVSIKTQELDRSIPRKYLGVTEDEMKKICYSTGKYGAGVFDPKPYCDSRKELKEELHRCGKIPSTTWVRDFNTWLRISHSIGLKYRWFNPDMYTKTSIIRQNIIEGVRNDFESGYLLDILVNQILDEVIEEYKQGTQLQATEQGAPAQVTQP